MEVIGVKKEKMGFEETELRLGLPGNNGLVNDSEVVIRKRSFCETEPETVDLMLNLSSSSKESSADPTDSVKKEKTLLPSDPAKPPAK